MGTCNQRRIVFAPVAKVPSAMFAAARAANRLHMRVPRRWSSSEPTPDRTIDHQSAHRLTFLVCPCGLCSQTVDFTKLDMATLKRYKRHYRLKTRQNVTKTELAMAVAKHFSSQTVDEADTISLF
eukprot:3378968-Prymnesium_polylepis.1